MKITVIAEDIANGERAMCYTCPVALALKRVTGQSWDVNQDRVYLDGGGNGYALPDKAMAWIAEFDKSGTGEPFTFSLRIRRKA